MYLDGRDIGTEILPNADFKFYVDAPIEIRAKRRFKELYSIDKSIEFNNILMISLLREVHWSNRSLTDTIKTLWGIFFI